MISLPPLEHRLNWAVARLQAMRPVVFVAVAAGLALGCTLFFHAPKLRLVLGPPLDGTFEWTRAITFLEQAKAPLDIDMVREPAMRWRVLPALVANWLQLGPAAAYVLPWLGVLACVVHAAATLLRITGDRVVTVLTLAALTGSGGLVTATNLVGMNDGWLILGLNVVAFSPTAWAPTVAGLLMPWVDERFLIAMPLALLCRIALTPPIGAKWALVGPALGVALYLWIRLRWEANQAGSVSEQFIVERVRGLAVYWRWIPLGWWMGFRAAWPLLLLPLVAGGRRQRIWLTAGASATLLAVTMLAADTTRSTELLIPLLMLGAAMLVTVRGAVESRLWLLLVTAANAIMPMSWVTYDKVWPIVPLPVEFLIFLKGA